MRPLTAGRHGRQGPSAPGPPDTDTDTDTDISAHDGGSGAVGDVGGGGASPGPAPVVKRAWALWRRPLAVATAGAVVLRLVTEWVGLVGQFGVDFPHRVARTPGLLTEVWNHWDAGYYLSIAQYGYPGRHLGPGQAANDIAFAPFFPWGTKAIHAVTGIGYLTSSELLSGAALIVAIAVIYRLAALDHGAAVAGAAVTMVLAWPAAFFLVAPYPESLALAFGAGALLAARRGRWLTAGVLAAAAAMTKYYLVILMVALAVAVWEERGVAPVPEGAWPRRLGRLLCAVVPTVAAIGAWMLYQAVHVGDALAFARAQSLQWHRHVAAPWTLFATTVSHLVHWRFLDTSTASVVELFDFVTVVLLAVMAVIVFARVRRSYGVLLGLSWCVYCFESFLVGEVREVLVLFPFFAGLGLWVAGHPWRERVLLALFVPCGYFLVERFVRGAFAG